MQVANVYPGAFNGEFNNEPIVQAELSTSLANDAIVARYYHASILRYQYQGINPNAPDFAPATLYGTSSGAFNINQTFNGTGANVGFEDLYQEPELDKLSGGSFEYVHPLANNDNLLFSVDRTYAQSSDYVLTYTYPAPNYTAVATYEHNLPPGTSQSTHDILSARPLLHRFKNGSDAERLLQYVQQYVSHRLSGKRLRHICCCRQRHGRNIRNDD